jgi:hypothetical protein
MVMLLLVMLHTRPSRRLLEYGDGGSVRATITATATAMCVSLLVLCVSYDNVTSTAA